MNKIEKTATTEKRVYAKPLAERIQLDNEISMVMMSTPPGDPAYIQPEHFNNNPFGANMA